MDVRSFLAPCSAARSASIPASPARSRRSPGRDFQYRNFGEAAGAGRGQLLNARRLAYDRAHHAAASSDVELRDYTDALAVIGVLERDPSARTQAIAMRSQIAALRGDPRAALTVLRRLEERTDPDAIGPWDVLALAAAYARLGRADAAFAWLNRVRTAERAQLARDPRFDALRRDRRFAGWVNG